MRILHVLHQYLPDHVGGVEHHARSLALAQAQAGHQVTLFCRRGAPGRRLERDVAEELVVYRAVDGPLTPVGRLRSGLHAPFLARCLSQVEAEAQPDLVHVHHLMGLPIHSLGRRGRTAPLVVTLHDYWWVCANSQLYTDYGQRVCDGPRWWLNCARCALARAGAGAAWPLAPAAAGLLAWRAALLRQLGRQVAAWIAPTAFVAAWYAAHGVPAERLYTAGHGIEPPPACLASPPPESAGAGLRLAYVGGLAPQKGVHVLVDAFNLLPPTARLTIAGDETAFPDYCAELRRRAAHPGIRFVGRLDRPNVWQTLSAADVLAVPSLWYETASLVIQEAFAVGTPVLASNHGALAERVQHGVNGLLVAPGSVPAWRDAMLLLMEQPNLLPQLRRGIRPVMTIAENAARVESIYHQVLDLRTECGTI